MGIDFHFDPVGVLLRVCPALQSAQVPYEVVGQWAVAAHVGPDILLDLALTRAVDLRVGIAYRDKISGLLGDCGFLSCDGKKFESSSFPGHPIRTIYADDGDEIQPEWKPLGEAIVPVTPLRDLVWMKLESNCTIDRVHLDGLDAAGLITPAMADALPAELRARLDHIRATE